MAWDGLCRGEHHQEVEGTCSVAVIGFDIDGADPRHLGKGAELVQVEGRRVGGLRVGPVDLIVKSDLGQSDGSICRRPIVSDEIHAKV